MDSTMVEGVDRGLGAVEHLLVVGGGLAGCEAAWQAAERGCEVTLVEMKPTRFSPAHISSDLAELVCSPRKFRHGRATLSPDANRGRAEY